jgi:hypothetical protein
MGGIRGRIWHLPLILMPTRYLPLTTRLSEVGGRLYLPRAPN